MSESSLSLLLQDEPALEAPTTPTPPPQPGEHNMRRRSQGIDPPRSRLDAHLRKHIHSHHLGVEKFLEVATPVQTPRRNLHGAATYSSDKSIRTGPDYLLSVLAPTEGIAAMHSPGGCITPAPPDDMAAKSPAGGRHTANDNDEDNVTLGFGITLLASKNAGHDRPVRPTMMESFAVAIADLPDLADPVHSYIWRETFMQLARRADAALADFHRELDVRVRPVNTLRELCANLKASCADLHTTVTATSSTLTLLVLLMGNTHERVSTLEAATAKHEADVATTMNTLAATTAAHATTAAAVAEIGTVVADSVNDRVGFHIGSLKSDVSSLGQDVLALRSLLANMHEKPPPTPPTTNTPAPVGTVSPHKPPAVVEVPPLQEAQPLDADDTPLTAAAGSPRPTSKLFPNVDSTNLRIDVNQHARFHAHPVDQRLPTGGRPDNDLTSSDGDRWAPGWQVPSWQQNWSQRAPPPNRSSPANPT